MIVKLFYNQQTMWLTLGAAAVASVMYIYHRLQNMYAAFESIPSFDGFSFIFGTLHTFPREAADQYKFMLTWLSTHRRMRLLWAGPFRPVLFVFHPDSAKVILQSSEPKPEGTGDVMTLLKPWTGEGLVVANGNKWFRNRHLLTPAFHFDILRSYVHVYNRAADILLETEGPSKKRYLDFVDILLTAKDDTGKGLSVAEIRAEVDTFLFAGHETSSTAISWLLHLLSENQDYQHHVQQEVDSLLSGQDSTDILWADLSQLEMLACCIKESLRLFPPAPGIARLLTTDTVIDGMKIPAGTRVAVSFLLMHRNPDVWENPDEFCPERFELEKAQDRNPFAFVPFSAGPRNCIGQVFASNEMKVLVAKLLHRYELTPDSNHPVTPVTASILHSETGVWVYAKLRDTSK